MTQRFRTVQELDDINEAFDSPDVSERFKKKLLVIKMVDTGATQDFVKDVLGVSKSSFTRYLREFRDGGLQATLEDRYYRASSSLEPFWKCIRCSFLAAPVADAKSAAERIETLTGIRLSESQCRRTMKKMGMSLKKCAQVPARADGQLQLDFFAKELLPRLAQASEGKGLVFFVDAAHFVLGAFLGMVWCFARPYIKTSPGRQRYSVLGALGSHSKELISIRTAGNIDSSCVHSSTKSVKNTPQGKLPS